MNGPGWVGWAAGSGERRAYLSGVDNPVAARPPDPTIPETWARRSRAVWRFVGELLAALAVLASGTYLLVVILWAAIARL